MKLSLTVLSAIAALVSADTVFVTNTHMVTVDSNGQPVSDSAAPTSAGQAGSSALIKTIATSAQGENRAFSLGGFGNDGPSSTQLFTSADFNPSTSNTGEVSPTSSSSEPSSSGGSSSPSGGFEQQILEAHNEKRSKHSAPSLSWSDELASYAEKMANDYQCGGSLQHSHGKYGENLAVGYDGASGTVQAWYDEGKNYQYSSATELNHFTQVIWKKSKQLGCAQKQCGSGPYVVCEYYPAGNMMGEGKENLSPN